MCFSVSLVSQARRWIFVAAKVVMIVFGQGKWALSCDDDNDDEVMMVVEIK